MSAPARSAILAVLALALVASSRTQGPHVVDWSRLLHGVSGKDAIIRLRDGGEARGHAVVSPDDTLTVDSRTLPCAEIASVDVTEETHRTLWTVLGAAAGLAAGAIVATRFSNEGNDEAAIGVAAGLAAAGAGIGFAAAGKGETKTFTLAPDSCGR